MTSWLLVHSPLLGPRSWARVAARLRALVPDLRPALDTGTDFAAQQAHFATAPVPPGASVWLAGHSGAGPLLPLIAAHLQSAGVQVEATVFVDAPLPHPGVTRRETLAPEVAAQLTGLTDDEGTLPAWPRWWPPQEIRDLVPDPGVRAAFTADCPPLPAAMFDERMPDGRDVPQPHYLQLSPAYTDDARRARRQRWPVRRMRSHHLAPLTTPDDVADALTSLVVTT